jgi:porin
LAILEGDYAFDRDPNAPGLAASYKVGAWFHSGSFADQRFDTAGLSLAAPASSGLPASRQHDGGAYFVLDRTVLRRAAPARQTISVFLRLSGAPSDRNAVSLYADAGIGLTGFVTSRPDDLIGLAAAVARIGSRARALDEDVRALGGPGAPVRDEEAAIELTYRSQVTPWWSLQPDLQFIRHPGGGAPPPGSTAGRHAIADALVVGVRSIIVF